MSAEITSITGLTNLTNLTRLEIDNHAIDGTLDVSGLSNLTYLDASDNDNLDSTGIKSLDVTGCTSLSELRMDDNDFSDGMSDLSDCTSLEFIDFDECRLQGSINLTNLPNLKGFDFNGNTDLTEVIISSEQPLGSDEWSINLTNCSSLTQTALDNILQQLSSGSVSGGNISFYNSALPSLQRGIPALTILSVDRGWDFGSDSYADFTTTTSVYGTSDEACTAIVNNETTTFYVYAGTNIEVGNRIFINSNLFSTVSDGFFGNYNDGLWYQVSGSNGTIVASGSCGV